MKTKALNASIDVIFSTDKDDTGFKVNLRVTLTDELHFLNKFVSDNMPQTDFARELEAALKKVLNECMAEQISEHIQQNLKENEEATSELYTKLKRAEQKIAKNRGAEK